MTLLKTPLNDIHKASGATLVDFAGWELPIYFSSIINEHKAIRNGAGMFDVSHMGEFIISGKDASRFLDYIFTNDFSSAPVPSAIYTHMLNNDGGVIDDLIAYKLADDSYMLVVNASRIEPDWSWISDRSKDIDVRLENVSDRFGIIALQGPRAMEIARNLCRELANIKKFQWHRFAFNTKDILAGRTGYTGEDGFEFICKNEILASLWKKIEDIVKVNNIQPFLPCGLGARDTLRLEAGFPLWGHELDEKTTPLEVGYSWVVKFKKDKFIGKDALLSQKEKGVNRKLKFAISKARGPMPRNGSQILTAEKKHAGIVTSGGFSPTLEKPIAACFVDKDSLNEKELIIDVAGRSLPVEILNTTPLNHYRSSSR
ncbi:glycine cleavage system aminomethyltransferase GcvT [Elusimicrobiota bacterium]